MHYKSFTTAFISVLLAAVFAFNDRAFADTVIFKSGKVVQGTVEGQSASDIHVKTETEMQVIPKQSLKKILYNSFQEYLRKREEKNQEKLRLEEERIQKENQEKLRLEEERIQKENQEKLRLEEERIQKENQEKLRLEEEQARLSRDQAQNEKLNTPAAQPLTAENRNTDNALGESSPVQSPQAAAEESKKISSAESSAPQAENNTSRSKSSDNRAPGVIEKRHKLEIGIGGGGIGYSPFFLSFNKFFQDIKAFFDYTSQSGIVKNEDPAWKNLGMKGGGGEFTYYFRRVFIGAEGYTSQGHPSSRQSSFAELPFSPYTFVIEQNINYSKMRYTTGIFKTGITLFATEHLDASILAGYGGEGMRSEYVNLISVPPPYQLGLDPFTSWDMTYREYATGYTMYKTKGGLGGLSLRYKFSFPLEIRFEGYGYSHNGDAEIYSRQYSPFGFMDEVNFKPGVSTHGGWASLMLLSRLPFGGLSLYLKLFANSSEMRYSGLYPENTTSNYITGEIYKQTTLDEYVFYKIFNFDSLTHTTDKAAGGIVGVMKTFDFSN